jgi:hypothetical protein
MCTLYRGISIDASYHVSVHLAKRFQRRLPQVILVSDRSIKKNSSPLKPLRQMNRNLVGSIGFRGEFVLEIDQSETRIVYAY